MKRLAALFALLAIVLVAQVAGAKPYAYANWSDSPAAGTYAKASRGRGWSPTWIVNVKGWYDPSVGVTLNGSTVSGWADQSGLGNNLTGAASHQPTFVSSDASYGHAQSMTYSAASTTALVGPAVNLAQPMWYAIVGHATTTGVIGFLDSTSSGSFQAMYANATGKLNVYAGTILAGTASVASPCVMIGVFNGASSAGYVSNYVTANPPTGNANTDLQQAWVLGGNSKATNPLTGTIAAFVAAAGTPDLWVRWHIMVYFGNRFGIAVQ